jgi:hypothetical protein
MTERCQSPERLQLDAADSCGGVDCEGPGYRGPARGLGWGRERGERILDDRFALGEISEEEYLKRREILARK